MNRNFQRRKDGHAEAFTLIELLVVIAVLTILAALLWPALSRARSAADSAVCKSNLRQMGIGARLYLDEFRAYPLAYKIPHWEHILEPYVGARWPSNNFVETGRDVRVQRAEGVYVCPGYNRIGGLFRDDAEMVDYVGLISAYGYNISGLVPPVYYYGGTGPTRCELGLGGELITTNDWRTFDVRPIHENAVVNPSDMIEFGDSVIGGVGFLGQVQPDGHFQYFSGWFPGGSGSLDLQFEPETWPTHAPWSLYKQRHGGRWNVAFCDGHVENLRPRVLFDKRRDDVLRRWNNDNQPHRELAPIVPSN